MKKKILYIAAILICLSIISSGTYAYFTKEATARNVITTGGIEVRVVEYKMENGERVPYTAPSMPVMPGKTVSKIVTVECLQRDAWLRARYTVEVFDEDGKKLDIPAAELEQAIIIEPDDSAWTETDGWWYYQDSIAVDSPSTPLFETVRFAHKEMDNKYQGCTVEIKVIAQAVQKVNNGTTITEAHGWPED